VDIEVASAGSGTPYATVAAQADGTGKWLATVNWRPGRNTVEVTDRLLATTTTFGVNVIDPEGVVYNAVTGSPVTGAVVNILDTAGNPVMAPVVTGADGRYSFLVPPGDYRMTVAADGYSAVPPGSSLVSVPAGNALVVTPVKAPACAVAWNVYVGFSVQEQTLQTSAPLAVNQAWTEPVTGIRQGTPPGTGQEAEATLRPGRTLLRG
jgi:uncharacterized membrane protein